MTESLGRSSVKLTPGQHVSITATSAFNSIVVRYAISDSSSGQLSLFINNVFNQNLTLTSKFTWLYGYPQHGTYSPDLPSYSKNPSVGSPAHFFDEVRALCGPATVPSGAKVTLRHEDKALQYVVVNVVDLEQVPPPLSRPPNSLSVTDPYYGAVGDGRTDDTGAIQHCINDAYIGGLVGNYSVWLGPGTYKLSSFLYLPVTTVLQGAGMWYSTLHQSDPHLSVLIFPGGNGSVKVSDLSLTGEVVNRIDADASSGIEVIT